MLGFVEFIKFVLIAYLLESLKGFGDPQIELLGILLGFRGSVAVFEESDVPNLTMLLQDDHGDIFLLAYFIDLLTGCLKFRISRSKLTKLKQSTIISEAL